jgi:hypothetical protein
MSFSVPRLFCKVSTAGREPTGGLQADVRADAFPAAGSVGATSLRYSRPMSKANSSHTHQQDVDQCELPGGQSKHGGTGEEIQK